MMIHARQQCMDSENIYITTRHVITLIVNCIIQYTCVHMAYPTSKYIATYKELYLSNIRHSFSLSDKQTTVHTYSYIPLGWVQVTFTVNNPGCLGSSAISLNVTLTPGVCASETDNCSFDIHHCLSEILISISNNY